MRIKAAIATLALLAASCGGSEDPSPEPVVTPPPTTGFPPATEAPVPETNLEPFSVTDDSSGATLAIEAGALPDGVAPADITFSRVQEADGDPLDAIEFDLGPDGLQLASPARLTFESLIGASGALLAVLLSGDDVEFLPITPTDDGRLSVDVPHFSRLLIVGVDQVSGPIRAIPSPGEPEAGATGGQVMITYEPPSTLEVPAHGPRPGLRLSEPKLDFSRIELGGPRNAYVGTSIAVGNTTGPIEILPGQPADGGPPIVLSLIEEPFVCVEPIAMTVDLTATVTYQAAVTIRGGEAGGTGSGGAPILIGGSTTINCALAIDDAGDPTRTCDPATDACPPDDSQPPDAGGSGTDIEFIVDVGGQTVQCSINFTLEGSRAESIGTGLMVCDQEVPGAAMVLGVICGNAPVIEYFEVVERDVSELRAQGTVENVDSGCEAQGQFGFLNGSNFQIISGSVGRVIDEGVQLRVTVDLIGHLI